MAAASPSPGQIRSPGPMVGTIEQIGQIQSAELFVSGWSRERPPSGSTVAVFTAGNAVQGQFWATWSDRPDVGPLSGFSGIVELAAPVAPSDIRGIVLANDRRSRLGVYEAAMFPDLKQAVGLLREAMSTGSAGDAQERLARIVENYEGIDTVSSSSMPVRIGIDDCIAFDGAGVIVMGWLFDPEGLVRNVSLVDASGTRRIDEGWIRQPRRDVTDSFAANPRFSGYPTRHHCHGFAALIPATSGAGDPYLTIDVAGGVPLHYPIAVRTGNAATLLRRFLMMLDPALPTSIDVVDRHLAPVIASICPRPRLATTEEVDFESGGLLSIVIGCFGSCADVPLLCSVLAAYPATRRTSIIIAAPAEELSAHSGDIIRTARFYGLSVRLAHAEAVEDVLDAITVGVDSADTELVCIMEAGVLPRTPEWLTKLVAARRLHGAGIIRPTIVNDDPAEPDDEERLGCRLLSKSDFVAIGGFSARFLDPVSKAMDFARRAADAGIPTVTVDQVELIAGAEEAAIPSAWSRLARRADRRASELGTRPERRDVV